MERQDRFSADDPFNPEDRTKGGLQVVGIGSHDPAPDIAPARDLVHLENLGEQAQGAHDAVEFAVGHLDRDESNDVVSHGLQVDFPASVVEDPGALHPSQARLGGVPGDAQLFAQVADLDPRVADQFQQDPEVGGVQGVQIITPGHSQKEKLIILLNSSMNAHQMGLPSSHSGGINRHRQEKLPQGAGPPETGKDTA
jgi:hypothetical protein